MLGIGPLVFAPVSETYGRRPMLVILTFLYAVLTFRAHLQLTDSMIGSLRCLGS